MLRATFKTRPTRALCLDLENRPSAYWYGDATTAEITAFGWKWADEKTVRTFLLQADGRFLDDRGGTVDSTVAYLAFRDVLCEADLVYGHNIRRHDLPLFQAGLLRRGLEPLPTLLTSDTLRDYPRRKDMSASLASLAAMYGIKGRKLGLSQPEWEKANRLAPEGVELARRRVVSDVVLQERLRRKMIEVGHLEPPRRWVGTRAA